MKWANNYQRLVFIEHVGGQKEEVELHKIAFQQTHSNSDINKEDV